MLFKEINRRNLFDQFFDSELVDKISKKYYSKSNEELVKAFEDSGIYNPDKLEKQDVALYRQLLNKKLVRIVRDKKFNKKFSLEIIIDS
jgi:hypothetical protein